MSNNSFVYNFCYIFQKSKISCEDISACMLKSTDFMEKYFLWMEVNVFLAHSFSKFNNLVLENWKSDLFDSI